MGLGQKSEVALGKLPRLIDCLFTTELAPEVLTAQLTPEVLTRKHHSKVKPSSYHNSDISKVIGHILPLDSSVCGQYRAGNGASQTHSTFRKRSRDNPSRHGRSPSDTAEGELHV